MGSNVITGIYYLLVVACVGISVYLSYHGYKSSFETLALPFTVVLGIGLFGADALIQRARVTGRSLAAPLFLFLLFAVFSAASNFNYLYTNFMEEDVLEKALDRQHAVFRDDLTNTRDALLATDTFTDVGQKRVELDLELARLRDQILDEFRFGCGERCRGHVQQIEIIVGVEFTDMAYPPPGTGKDRLLAWYEERVKDAALRNLEKTVQLTNYSRVVSLVDSINELLLRYDTPDRAKAEQLGRDVLGQLSIASQDVERAANSILPQGDRIDHSLIDTTLGRLGEIVYSFENGFGEMPNVLATVLSAILSVVIDVFPVFFALVAFSPDPGRVNKTAPRRGRAGTILE